MNFFCKKVVYFGRDFTAYFRELPEDQGSIVCMVSPELLDLLKEFYQDNNDCQYTNDGSSLPWDKHCSNRT